MNKEIEAEPKESTEWKLPLYGDANAEKVSAEIKGIGEEVRPADLVDYARNNPHSELHKCFEWDDTAAAEKYRLQQAGKILRLVATVSSSPDVPTHRSFYCVRTEKGSSAYKPAPIVFVNSVEREDLLSRAIKELKAFENKYWTLTELADVFKAIDEL